MTTFICEKCATVAEVEIGEHEDILSGVRKIESKHHQLSPNCDNPVSMIRVLNKGFLLKREVA